MNNHHHKLHTTMSTTDEIQKIKDLPLWQNDTQWKKEVLLCRGITLTVMAAIAFNIDYLDRVMVDIWASCLQSHLFRHDTFEPFVVSISFAVVLSYWRILDQLVPPQWLRKYKLHNTTYDDLKGWWENKGDLVSTTVLWYLLPLLAFDIFYPRRALPEEAPTFGQVVWDVFKMLFIYDFFFTFGHYALHKVPTLYKFIHQKHHTFANTHAIETFRLSFLEQWINVGCSILAVNLSKGHPFSRVIYNIVIVYLLTELHSGYNFPFMIANIAPLNIVGGSYIHHLHHSNGKFHFGKFFTYLDMLFGTIKPVTKER
eukprot:Awhi_evm1s6014